MDITHTQSLLPSFCLWRERGGNMVLGCSAVTAVNTSKKLSSGNQHAWSEEKTSWSKKDLVVCHCSSLPFDTNKYIVHSANMHTVECSLQRFCFINFNRIYHWKHFLIKTLCAEYFHGISNTHYCCYQIECHQCNFNISHDELQFQIHMNGFK